MIKSITKYSKAALLVLLIVCSQTGTAQAITTGGGLLLYGEGVLTTPRLRMYKGVTNAWSTQGTMATVTTVPRQTIVEASPTNQEAIAGTVTSGGVLNILKWNGYSWTNQWSVTTTLGNIPRFDIAYEQSSGQAVVMYSKNVATTNELAYRVWSPTTSTWSAETNYDAVRTAGVINSVRLTTQQGSDNLAVAWGDAALDLSANWWNGSTNTWGSEPTAALSVSLALVSTATTLTNTSFDIAIEQSGEIMVAWGNNTVTDLLYATRTAGSSGTWSAVTTNTAFVSEPTDMNLRTEPGSDYIGYANSTDVAATTEAGIWNGSAWIGLNTIDTTSDTAAVGTRNSTIEWLSSGGSSRAIVTYDDLDAAGVDWVSYDKAGGTWTAQADFTTAPAPAALNDVQHLMVRRPDTNSRLMLFVVDQNLDLFAKQLTFDGTNLVWTSTEPSAVALNVNIPNAAGGWTAGYDYIRVITASGLSTDIVDANDATVASPSVAFNTVVMSPSCQSTTGALGTAAQKIRIKNFTATPGWTMSIAATSGNTSNWSSGLSAYDYNDTSGSPSGCTDGADADSNAGLLTINPSVGTITPDTTCVATNVTKGSSASYNQGTIDNITLVSASASAEADCFWDFTGATLTQTIPTSVTAGTYNINLTITTVAN